MPAVWAATASFQRQRMLLNAWPDSQYDNLIERWGTIAEPGKLFVTSVEELSLSRECVLGQLGDWLGIDSTPLIAASVERSNPTKATRSRLLQAPLRELARESEEGGPVAKSLTNLRIEVEKLDPTSLNLEPGWLITVVFELSDDERTLTATAAGRAWPPTRSSRCRW